ncbi:MAG TPA: 3',5'-cyclic-nucleotide phosphodiesterase, partial [Nitrospirae bacterium]|nr:3',5'-cyclic-nucleotide phosphodiesterase [Nitrospirota bacterium]
SFLLDDSILIDAGTTTAAIGEGAQKKIGHIIITHSHFDHIRGIPTLADNMFLRDPGHSITLVGTKAVLQVIRKNLLNNIVWPDFTRKPNLKKPALKLKVIKTGKPFRILDYRITAERTDHTVPAAGYIIENSKGKKLLYTGDTGPTDRIWKRADMRSGKTAIDGAIIEVTFPNRMKAAAERTGHLTPALLLSELKKLRNFPKKLYITHIKPQYITTVTKELQKLKIKNLKILEKDRTYVI